MKLKPVLQSRTYGEIRAEFNRIMAEEESPDLMTHLCEWIGIERAVLVMEILEAHCKYCHRYIGDRSCHCMEEDE